MPWRKVSLVDQRLEFIADLGTWVWSMTELYASYGISRKTGYKWAARFQQKGPLGLADRSRRPQHSPQAVRPVLPKSWIVRRRRAVVHVTCCQVCR